MSSLLFACQYHKFTQVQRPSWTPCIQWNWVMVPSTFKSNSLQTLHRNHGRPSGIVQETEEHCVIIHGIKNPAYLEGLWCQSQPSDEQVASASTQLVHTFGHGGNLQIAVMWSALCLSLCPVHLTGQHLSSIRKGDCMNNPTTTSCTRKLSQQLDTFLLSELLGDNNPVNQPHTEKTIENMSPWSLGKYSVP